MIVADNLNAERINNAARELGITSQFEILLIPNLMKEAIEAGVLPPETLGDNETMLGATLLEFKPISMRLDPDQSPDRMNKTIWHELGHIKQLDVIFHGDVRRMKRLYQGLGKQFGYNRNPFELHAQLIAEEMAPTRMLVES